MTEVELKEKLHALCIEYVQKRIGTVNTAINSAQAGANEETKSSAGDKYETGRVMMQQESDRNKAQLYEANKLMMALNKVSTSHNTPVAETGSIVITNKGSFYLAIAAGKLIANGETYFAVSHDSPIGIQLMGKKTGNSFTLNGNVFMVEKVL